MTAPTYDDEARLRHFVKAKPYHTGHHLKPGQQCEPWTFVSEDAVERYELAHHALFCRACSAEAKHGRTYTPLLVDFQKNPLGDKPQVLASTHCMNCGAGEMYPVETLTWDINDRAVTETIYPPAITGSQMSTEQYKRYFQQAQQHLAQQVALQGMQGMGQQAQYGAGVGTGQLGGYATPNQLSHPPVFVK